MKLLLDSNGNVVVRDGKPVYVYDDGKEVPVDAPELFKKIKTLNEENKTHREAKEALEAQLAKFGDVDPDDIEAFLDEIDSLGGIDAVREGSKVDVDKLKAEYDKVYGIKLEEKDRIIQAKDMAYAEKEKHIFQLEVSNRFKSTPVMSKLVVPSDMVESAFGHNFKIEGGVVVGYLNGQKIYSRERAGELADFDEALSQIIDAYPAKDRILKGTGSGGSGAAGGGAMNQVGYNAALASMSPVERITAARASGQKT